MKRFIQGTAFFVLAAVLLLWPKSLFAQDAAVVLFLGIDYIEPGQEINLSPDGETADYIYDGNGNMTYDALRHIAMTYDINNLVSTVSRNDTLLSTYTYLADGTKYKVLDTAGNGRSYIGPFCMAIEKTGTGSSAQIKAYLESIDTDSGRILAIREQTGSGANILTNTAYTTAFFTKDHLGSVRAVTDARGNILERNAYYPFGLQNNQNLAFPTIPTSLSTLYPNSISSVTARQDLYNGKEIQTTAGTDYLDYGFRQYDPTIARWFNIDPKAEKYRQLTPYNYCNLYPIKTIDIEGRQSITPDDKNQKKISNNNKSITESDIDEELLIPSQPFFTYSKSKITLTVGEKKTFNIDFRRTTTRDYQKIEKRQETTEYQLNSFILASVGFSKQLNDSKTSIHYSLGISTKHSLYKLTRTENSNPIHSSLSFSVGVKLDNHLSTEKTFGIKPLGLIGAVVVTATLIKIPFNSRLFKEATTDFTTLRQMPTMVKK